MSVRELEKPENEAKKNSFLRGFKLIKDLSPDNPNSFWAIAGYHGAPFKTSTGWGGWCQHGNVLFPTWHRWYVWRLEQALRTVCPDDDITVPYWDETSEDSLKGGIPKMLTDEEVIIDGKSVKNPLNNFTLPAHIELHEKGNDYSKPEGYTTVRYPFSGIRSPAEAKQKADQHNVEVMKRNKSPVEELNENVNNWLHQVSPWGSMTKPMSTYMKFVKCLNTPSYNDFSNISSARRNGKDHGQTSLESPHNDIHLLVGGYTSGANTFGLIKGSNGDMGENETAAFDPIFFMHHCNIDRMFWIWQKKHGKTNKEDLTIDPDDEEGTIADSKDDQGLIRGQGLTRGQKSGEHLGMLTPLYPFQHPNGIPATSADCINIHDLGYDYSIGSLDQEQWPKVSEAGTTKYHYVDSIEKIKEIMARKKEDSNSRNRFIIDHRKVKEPSFMIRGQTFSINNIDTPAMNVANAEPNDTPIPRQEDLSAEPNDTSISWKADLSVKVAMIDKNAYAGSMLVRLYYKEIKPDNFIGQVSLLNRRNRKVCENCQFHRFANCWFYCKGLGFIMSYPRKPADFKAVVVHFDIMEGVMKEDELDVESVVASDVMEGAMKEEEPDVESVLASGHPTSMKPTIQMVYNFAEV